MLNIHIQIDDLNGSLQTAQNNWKIARKMEIVVVIIFICIIVWLLFLKKFKIIGQLMNWVSGKSKN